MPLWVIISGAVEASAGGAGAAGVSSSTPLGSPRLGALGGSALTAAHIATQPAGVDTQAVSAGSQVGTRGAATGFPGFWAVFMVDRFVMLHRLIRHQLRNAVAQHGYHSICNVSVATAGTATTCDSRSKHGSYAKERQGTWVLQHMPQTPNARDLLGENPPTVPGVIGTWVRIDPQERTPNDFRTGLIG